MCNLERIPTRKRRGGLAICGLAVATILALMPGARVLAAVDQPITLALTYVPPPHVPGAKVRTPEGPAALLAERLSKSLPLETVQLADGAKAKAKAEAEADARLVPLTPEELAAQAEAVIPTGYRAGIMAIMRTDTDIKRWEDLRDRTVCLAEGSGLAGEMHARYGAIEKVYRAPADALLDLRIGGCDATVHDSTMLHALLAFPEWKKFSAQLPIQEERELAFVVSDPAADWVQEVRSAVRNWQSQKLLAKLTQQSAHDIAFEVYMDQEVPDCH